MPPNDVHSEELRDRLYAEIQVNLGFSDISEWGADGRDNYDKMTDSVMQLIETHTANAVREARISDKQENVRDFSAVVKAFNEALSAGFDRPSVYRLRTVINGADARANYIDLPEQSDRIQSLTEGSKSDE